MSELTMLKTKITFDFGDGNTATYEAELLPVFEWGKDFNVSKNSTLKIYTPKEWMQEIIDHVSALKKTSKHNYFLLRTLADEN